MATLAKDESYEALEIENTALRQRVTELEHALDISREQEKAHAQREQCLKATLEQNTEGVFNWHIATGKISVSPQWLQMLGYQPSTFHVDREALEKLIHPDDLPYVHQTLRDHVEGRTPRYQSEYRVWASNGTWKWVLDRGSVVERDEQGQPLRLTSVYTDITERKHTEETLRKEYRSLEEHLQQRVDELSELNAALQAEITERKRAEEALRQNQVLLQRIIDTIPAAVYVKDTEGHLLLVNQYYASLRHLDQNHILQKPDTHVLSPDFVAEWRIYDEQVLATGKPLEFEQVFWQDDGPHTYLTIKFLIYDMHEAFTAIGSISTDITGRKRTEEALRESEARYRAIVEDQTEHICRFRPDGTLIFTNEASCRYLGKRQEQLNRRNFLAFVHDEDREKVKAYLASFNHEKPVGTREHRIITASGEMRWQNCTDRALFDASGRIVEFQAVCRDVTDRVQAEDAYKALVERSMQGVVIFQDMRVMFSNPMMEHISGYSTEELLAMSSTEVNTLIHAEDQGRIWGYMKDRLDGRPAPPRYEYRIIRKDGEVRWMDVSSALIQYRGRPANQIFFMDITERKQAEEQLRASEQKFRSIVEHSGDGITLIDEQGMIIEWNASVEQITGLKRDDVLGHASWDVLAQLCPDEHLSQPMREQHKADTEAFLATGEAPWLNELIEHIIQRPDGQRRYIQEISSGIKTSYGFMLCSITRDITERMQTEAALRESEQRYQRILDAVTDYIYMVQVEHGQVVQTVHGSGCVAVTGYTSEEYAADPYLWYRMIHEEDRDMVTDHANKILVGSEIAPLEHRIIHKDGSIRWVRNTPALHHNEAGELVSYDSLISDITERKQAEKELAEERALLALRVRQRTADLSIANAELARSMRVKDEFLTTMSHELRTPLNAILGLTAVLKEQLYGPINDDQKDTLNIIGESGRRLLNLINDILDLSKIEAGKTSLLCWPVVIESVCQASVSSVMSLAHEKCIDVLLHVDNPQTTIHADERRLKQILINLLSNAIKFTPKENRVGLTVTTEPDKEIVHFTVWDNGNGVAPENVELLFKPFVQLDSGLTRQYGGTGLGLALVARLVELHGGSVSVESVLGKGSQFTVSLPFVSSQDTMSHACAYTSAGASDEWGASFDTSMLYEDEHTVVLAENDETIITRITNTLSEKRYRVIATRNGTEMIERVREEHPKAIVMDLQMPGMDGWEILRRVRGDEKLQGIPIIAITSLERPGDCERCLQAGGNAYLKKPIHLQTLVTVIEQLIACQRC